MATVQYTVQNDMPPTPAEAPTLGTLITEVEDIAGNFAILNNRAEMLITHLTGVHFTQEPQLPERSTKGFASLDALSVGTAALNAEVARLQAALEFLAQRLN